jgi:hypothetical protein
VADEHGNVVQPVDDAPDVVHIVSDPVSAKARGAVALAVSAQIDGMAAIAVPGEVGQEVLAPAPFAVPGAVDENHRRLVGHYRWMTTDLVDMHDGASMPARRWRDVGVALATPDDVMAADGGTPEKVHDEAACVQDAAPGSARVREEMQVCH